MKTKTFDCVEMKRKGAQRVQEMLQGMTVEEQLAFWDKKHEELVQRQDELRKNARKDQ
jgi:hypothetical protein